MEVEKKRKSKHHNTLLKISYLMKNQYQLKEKGIQISMLLWVGLMAQRFVS